MLCPCVGLQQEAKNHPRKNHSYIRFANLYQLKSIFTNFSHFQGFPFVIRQAPKLFRHLTSSSFPSHAHTPAWRINYSRVYIRQSHVCASVSPERPWKISPLFCSGRSKHQSLPPSVRTKLLPKEIYVEKCLQQQWDWNQSALRISAREMLSWKAKRETVASPCEITKGGGRWEKYCGSLGTGQFKSIFVCTVYVPQVKVKDLLLLPSVSYIVHSLLKKESRNTNQKKKGKGTGLNGLQFLSPSPFWSSRTKGKTHVLPSPTIRQQKILGERRIGNKGPFIFLQLQLQKQGNGAK